jgi:hypothetical protein
MMGGAGQQGQQEQGGLHVRTGRCPVSFP